MQQNFKNIFSIIIQLLLFHAVQCSCTISTEVTQQLFIVAAAIKKVVAQQLLHCYFKLPIEGSNPTPRGTTGLTEYAIHMIVATAVEYTRSQLRGIFDCLIKHYLQYIPSRISGHKVAENRDTFSLKHSDT